MELNLISWETHTHSTGVHHLLAVSSVWTSPFINKCSSIPDAVCVSVSLSLSTCGFSNLLPTNPQNSIITLF